MGRHPLGRVGMVLETLHFCLSLMFQTRLFLVYGLSKLGRILLAYYKRYKCKRTVEKDRFNLTFTEVVEAPTLTIIAQGTR